jgi:hypothetical protein
MLNSYPFSSLAASIVATILLGASAVSAQIRGVATKPAVAAAAAQKIEVVQTDLSSTAVSDGNKVSGLRGVISSDAENPAGDRDTYASIPTVQSQLLASIQLGLNTRRLKDDPDVQKYLDVATSIVSSAGGALQPTRCWRCVNPD